MRRVYMILLSVIVLAAATASAGAVDFGIKGGLNIANLHGEDVSDDSDWKTGFAGGVFLNWGVTPVFSIQPELLYVQNGTKDSVLDGELSLKFNYLQIPVLAMVDLPVGGGLIPVLYTGPYFGIRLDSKLVVEAGGASASASLDDYTETYDTGFVFGAAFEFGAGPGKMTLEGRYVLGMTQIDTGLVEGIFGVEEAPRSDAKNESWMIMLGFAF